MKIYKIVPVAKPRMTRSDRWKKRKCVLKYFNFRDKVKDLGITVPESGSHILFILPMSKFWSKKKCLKMNGKPHKNRPDKDNLEKALLDAIFNEDCHIWDSRTTKLWGREGRIIIGEL